MQKDLEMLKNNISSLVGRYKQQQQDNRILQEKVDFLSQKNQELEKKVTEVRVRIENLITSLPGAESVK